MSESCDTLYSEASVREALQLWGDDAPDPDSDRRADLERALTSLTDQEVTTLRLWSWGYKAREIAAAVMPGKNTSTAWRFAGRCIARLQNAMNGGGN